ncbi:MAG TPA: polyprenyl synthetase family protein [Clostridia bacterium]|nr:polyprenyl synthetase family protein [Clostridia bacterium]
MTLEGVVQELETDLQRVGQKVREVVKSSNPLLARVTEYFLSGSGKGLRPILVLLSGGFSKYRDDRVISLAAALELVHMASLLHDDVIDNSDTRRGQMSVNAKWNNQIAVLLGDFFYAKALNLVGSVGKEGVEAVAQIINTLTEGEFEQLSCQFNTLITEDDYFQRIEKKTARFIATCCKLGALYSEAPEEVVDLLSQYGFNLGMAYQIRDDILDFTANKKTLGKPVGSDLQQGIITLPVIHGINYSSKGSEIINIIKSKKPDFAAIYKIIRETGSISYAQKKAEQFSQRARECLLPLPECKAKNALRLIVDLTEARTS